MIGRGLLILLAILLLGFVAEQAAHHLFQRPPSEWLCHEYGLTPGQAERMKALQNEYGSRCGSFCDAMCEANSKLEQVALGSSSVTPEVRAALSETDRIRTETRAVMLEHFYAVAAELPPEKRRDYLLKVLPLVIDSCGSR